MFVVVDENGENVEIPVKVEASGPFEALAKAAGYAHEKYPTISGTIKSERFVDYATAMIRRSHD